jgi:hypothetical protein
VVAASYLGWTLDAFDFFLMVFVLKDIAQEFHTGITQVTVAILLTLAMRPVGAFLFGRAADRWGQRPTLMVDVLFYSVIEFASGFAPSLTALTRDLRHRHGRRMGRRRVADHGMRLVRAFRQAAHHHYRRGAVADCASNCRRTRPAAPFRDLSISSAT